MWRRTIKLCKIVYLCLILGECLYTDYREGKIKNRQVLAVLAGAFIRLLLEGSGQAWRDAFVMQGIFFAVLFPLYVIRALGAGDVKVLCAVAFYIGRGGMKAFLLGACVSGAILALGKLLYHRLLVQRIRFFVVYIKNLLCTGQMADYGIPQNQKEVLRLALPVFFGGLCWGLEVL